MRQYIIAIDFDGTIAEKLEDPLAIGNMIANANEVINSFYDMGCYIIIWTVRNELKPVIDFLNNNKIKFHKINENATSTDFITSRKIFFDLCIDDRNIFADINWFKIKDEVKELYANFIFEEVLSAFSKIKIAQRGMPEGIQNWNKSKGLKQLEIMSPDRDWINDEALLQYNDLVLPDTEHPSSKSYGILQDVRHKRDNKNSEEYSNSPKRDNTHRYKTVDQPIDRYRGQYYREQKPTNQGNPL
jgi:hypothetical protein